MDQPLTLLTLIALLLAATVSDARHRKIPNWVTMPGFLLGFLLTVASSDTGITSAIPHSFLGAAVALALWLPVYVLGKFGAGDVKLLVMAGTFLGPVGILWASLWTLIAGGFLAAAVLISTYGVRNIYHRAAGSFAVAQSGQGAVEGAATIEKDNALRKTGMPYAAAIAAGSLVAYVQL